MFLFLRKTAKNFEKLWTFSKNGVLYILDNCREFPKGSLLKSYTYPFPITMSDWYLKHGDKEYGPMDSSKLKQLAAQNKIRPTDYIRRGADGKWTLASHAKGLFNETASNDPSAPSPINVHSGDANSGAVPPVPPVAPNLSASFSQKPIAPPVASAIPVAQKTASSASSSMSFGDGIEFTHSSPASSSSKKGKKSKKKGPAPMDKKTVLIASIAGGSVLVLILLVVLIFALKNDNGSNAPAADKTEVAQSDKGEAAPAEGENANADNSAADEDAAADDNAIADENAEANPGEESDQPIVAFETPKDAIDSATGSAKAGDVEIKVVSIKQGIEAITEKDGSETDSPDRSTIITLSVKNINDKKTVTFTPWSVQIANGKRNSVLLRDTENVYGIALKPGEVPTSVKRETHTLYSDDPPVTDVLVFKRFVPGAKELFLTLPVPGNPSQSVVFRIKTENVGGAGAAKPKADAAEGGAAEGDSESPIVSESAPAEDFNPEDDDEYNEINGVSEAQQKKDQEEADAELKALNLGD